MTGRPDCMLVTCCGRVLRSYTRVPGDPPQWHLMPSLAEQRRHEFGLVEDPRWSNRHGSAVELRCRACRFHAKHRLDRVYGEDFPPFTEVFERLRDNGIGEVAARSLDTLADWPTRLR